MAGINSPAPRTNPPAVWDGFWSQPTDTTPKNDLLRPEVQAKNRADSNALCSGMIKSGFGRCNPK